MTDRPITDTKLTLEGLRKDAILYITNSPNVLYVITEKVYTEVEDPDVTTKGPIYRGVKLTYLEGRWGYTSDVSIGGSYLSLLLKLNPNDMNITKNWNQAMEYLSLTEEEK